MWCSTPWAPPSGSGSGPTWATWLVNHLTTIYDTVGRYEIYLAIAVGLVHPRGDRPPPVHWGFDAQVGDAARCRLALVDVLCRSEYSASKARGKPV